MQPLKILKPFQPTWNLWMLLVSLQKEKAWEYLVFKKRKLWLDNLLTSAPNRGWLRAYIRVLCNQCYEQLEVTLQLALWDDTFVNTSKAVQIYFIDKFLW